MSLSDERRLQERSEVMRNVVLDVGEAYAEATYIDTSQPQYDSVNQTTWDDLLQLGHIKHIAHTTIAPTVVGWRMGVVQSNLHTTPEFQQKIGRLSAHLKNSVKSRQDSALIATHVLSSETGLDDGFILNVLESHFFETVHNRQGASVESDGQVITVPRGYGLSLI